MVAHQKKSPRSLPPALVALLTLLFLVSSTSAEVFDFATYSWDTDDTPRQNSVLTPGTYSGAVVTLAPTDDTSMLNFPNPPTDGFRGDLAFGALFDASNPPKAINLPAGNNGTTQRSGISATWMGGRALPNLTGADLVIYESASNSTSPEAFMIQVRAQATQTWSSWYYRPADVFALYNPAQGDQGATATEFDLTDFGIADEATIDAVRIVNMTDEDRMMDNSGIGVVLPEDNGTTSINLPIPPVFASFDNYGASTFDPDPLFLAALHDVGGPPIFVDGFETGDTNQWSP